MTAFGLLLVLVGVVLLFASPQVGAVLIVVGTFLAWSDKND